MNYFAVGLLSALVAGCGHVPIGTVYKLMTADVLQSDPAAIRAAARFPAALLPRPDGVKLVITLKPARPGEPETLNFALQDADSPSDAGEIAIFKRDGYPVRAYKLSDADAKVVAKLFAELRTERSHALKRSVSIAMSADACHTGTLPAQAIFASTYLKLDAKAGYMTVLEDIDLRKEFGADKLAKNIPPCARDAG